MTTHIHRLYREGRPLEVVIGWDHQLERFFLRVEFLDVPVTAGTVKERFLYLNLDEKRLKNKFPKSLRRFRRKLKRLKLKVEEAMLQHVERDGDYRVISNKVQDWTPEDNLSYPAPREEWETSRRR